MIDYTHLGSAPSRPSNVYLSSAQQAKRDAKLDPKLVTAAHQFEASMMQELLKPLNSQAIFGEDEDESSPGSGGASSLTSSADGSGNALMSFGSEALAKALSEKGGLGIARKILDQFEEHSPSISPDFSIARPK